MYFTIAPELGQQRQVTICNFHRKACRQVSEKMQIGQQCCGGGEMMMLKIVVMMITCQPNARESKATKTPSLLVLKAP